MAASAVVLLLTPHAQVPNALLAEVKGTAGGCSAISISREGRWLAAACGDDKGCFKVQLVRRDGHWALPGTRMSNV